VRGSVESSPSSGPWLPAATTGPPGGVDRVDPDAGVPGSPNPATVHTARALWVTRSSDWFPPTVVIASMVTPGSPAATRRARASS